MASRSTKVLEVQQQSTVAAKAWAFHTKSQASIEALVAKVEALEAESPEPSAEMVAEVVQRETAAHQNLIGERVLMKLAMVGFMSRGENEQQEA